MTKDSWGAIARLPWSYNAQTHVENRLPDYWFKHLDGVKIIHYTRKKGWKCPELYTSPTTEEKNYVYNASQPLYCCLEGYRWWNYLREAKEKGGFKFNITNK